METSSGTRGSSARLAVRPQSSRLLRELIQTRKLADARGLAERLRKEHGFGWRAVGDRENNYGAINIGSDPGYALIERVTNAQDAVIELEAERHPSRYGPRTPRQAVEAWFGIPQGRASSLEPEALRALGRRAELTIWDGCTARRPTVEIRDRGVGLTPAQVPGTILSLGESNKIDKPFLAGAYGQGGSTVLAFSPGGASIATRRQPDLLARGDADCVAVTFARYRDLDPRYNKNGRYEYLVDPSGEVASILAAELPDFAPGTSVTHFDLQADRYAASLAAPTGNLRWLLEHALFDPVLPVTLGDLRSRHQDPDGGGPIVLGGNHARLCAASDSVELTGRLEVLLSGAGGNSRILVHYWAVRESEDGSVKQPIDRFVDPFRPVVYTYYGQTHGTDERRFVTERLGLPYLAKFLVVQVELDGLAARARRELLSTTRDRLKKSALYDEMRERIAKALAADPHLQRLNARRKESVLSRHSEEQRQQMRERFARLMERYRAGLDVWAAGKGDGDSGREAAPSGQTEAEEEPLPTAPSPTFLRIANRRPVRVRLGRLAVLRLESDAPDGCLAAQDHARLRLATEPEGRLVVESASDFRGGRARLQVRAAPAALAGETGVLTVYFLTRAAEVLSDQAEYAVEEPPAKETSGDRGRARVQVPEPIAIHRDQWSEFGWDEASVAEVRQEKGRGAIFVNLDNRHLRRLLEKANYREQGHKQKSNSYLLYVAFYAWLQHQGLSRDGVGLEGEPFERYKQQELDRAAQTVIHTISAGSRLED